MKLKFFVLALGLLCALSTPTLATATGDSAQAIGLMSPLSGGAGPEVPFPLSAQVDFPWANIEGVWLAKGKGVSAMFSFRIQSDASYNRILKVTQLTPDAHSVIAQGTGFSNDDARLVRAGMVIGSTGKSYWLIIRAFKNDKTGNIETVLTLRPFGGTEDGDIHIVVRKLSSIPAYEGDSTAIVSPGNF